MARNGSGVYVLPAGQPVVTGSKISSAAQNMLMTDISTALTTSLATDGQTAMSANLPMGNNKITGLSAGTVATDAITLSQLNQGATALAASSGASLVGFIQAWSGATARDAQSKLRESVSVKDFGAVGDGVADALSAFALAGAASNLLSVPAGVYPLASTPAMGNTLLNVGVNASLTGAGGTALGYTANAKEQTLHNGTSGADFATKYIRRNVTHTGGSVGFVASGLRVDSYVGAGAANYEWAITGMCDSSATGGQNVGVYGQGIKRGAGPVWGMVAEALDPTGTNNPITGLIGIEVDCRANGTDSLSNRIGIDIVINRQTPTGAANQVGYGVRLQNGGDASTSVKTGFSINCSAAVGFDTSAATITQAAFKLAVNQNIAFDSAAVNQLGNDGAGLTYSVSGVKKSRLNNTGGLELDSLQTVLSGAPASGGATPTLSANKPGANGGVTTWFSVVRSGTQLWIPGFSN